jgi:tetratricopeptide (TPR) repeat protein
MGGRVRQRLNEYYDNGSDKDELIITIPKGSYVPIFKKKTHLKRNTGTTASQQTSRGPTLALASFSDATQSTTSNRLLFQITDTIATELSRFLCLQLVVCNPYADKDRSHLIEAEMKSTNRADYILALYLQETDPNKNIYQLIYRLVFVDTGEILWSENFAVNAPPINDQDTILAKITARVADHQQGEIHTHWSRKQLENVLTIPDYNEVLVYFRYYTDRLRRSAFAKGVNFCSEALNRNPNDVIANVIYSSFCRHEFVYGYGIIELPLKRGRECAETAIRIKPNSHEAHYVLGQILFCKKNWKRSIEEFELARSLCKNNLEVEYGIGFQLCMMNKWDKGLPLVKKAMLLSTSYPSMYHLVPFLDYYRQEKYKQALHETKKITAPGLVYGPLTRSISYAQLGEFEKAEKEFQEVLRRYPKFMETGRMHVTRFLGSELLAEKVWDGVLKVINYSK